MSKQKLRKKIVLRQFLTKLFCACSTAQTVTDLYIGDGSMASTYIPLQFNRTAVTHIATQ